MEINSENLEHWLNNFKNIEKDDNLLIKRFNYLGTCKWYVRLIDFNLKNCWYKKEKEYLNTIISMNGYLVKKVIISSFLYCFNTWRRKFWCKTRFSALGLSDFMREYVSTCNLAKLLFPASKLFSLFSDTTFQCFYPLE